MRAPRSDVGAGLAPARPARPIRPDERIHVVGVAGAGASAAAWLAAAAGARVSGCDPGLPSAYTQALEAMGLVLAATHAADHVVAGSSVLVDRLGVTKALTSVQPDHPELTAARRLGIPVEAWQQVVADAAASQGGQLVAVAGTHGKSTSSGWLLHVLVAAGRDPAAFVGALLPAGLAERGAATARWGRGDCFVVEADEYAGNFDAYRPHLAVVLNAEWDHPDVFIDRAAVIDAFEAWLRAPGAEARRVVVNTGDLGGRELAERLRDWGPRVTRVEPAATGPAGALARAPAGRAPARDATVVRWRVIRGHLVVTGLPAGRSDARAAVGATLRLSGAHNAANAACVAAAAALLDVEAPRIAASLGTFAGVGRRMEVRADVRGILIVDDYAHHPTAIRATIAALRERHPGRRLWAVHEPLTYHRTAAMIDQLADALALADEAVVADIWPGRDPDTTITSAAALARAVSERSGRPVASPGTPEQTALHLLDRVAPGDLVLTMGGGRSYVIAEELARLLADGPRG